MSQYFRVHPDNPQARLIRQVVAILRSGGVVVYPTDSAYALGCMMGNKSGLDTILKIRQLSKRHNFTIICEDLSQLGAYARVDNSVYRLLRAYTPGPYTFVLKATNEVPKRLMHPKRKTIGLRVPDNRIAQLILAELGEPLMTVTLTMPGETYPLNDPDEIRDRLIGQVDAVVDGGWGDMMGTTIVDLVEGVPIVLREGKGDPAPFVGEG